MRQYPESTVRSVHLRTKYTRRSHTWPGLLFDAHFLAEEPPDPAKRSLHVLPHYTPEMH